MQNEELSQIMEQKTIENQPGNELSFLKASIINKVSNIKDKEEEEQLFNIENFKNELNKRNNSAATFQNSSNYLEGQKVSGNNHLTLQPESEAEQQNFQSEKADQNLEQNVESFEIKQINKPLIEQTKQN